MLFGAWDKREAEEKRDLTFGLAVGGGVVAAGLAASWAMAEHASTGLQPGIAMPVDVLHLLAVAAWLGGLTALLVALYRAPAGTPVAAVAVRRFSAVAFGSVVVLAATGTYQSWRQLGSWSAFTGTRYGQYLLAKIGLVALLVGIAWISRRWTGRLRDAAALSSTGSADDGELEKVGADGRAGEGTGKRRAPADARGAEGAGSGRGSAGVRTGTRPVAADPDSASGTDPDGGTDPERAAQLARQRAVMEAARRKRERDADPERSGLRRSVLAEACVAVVLLAVTTALTQTEPGRTEEAARAAASSAPPRPPPRPAPPRAR
ncbi:hypothetical protein GCM10020256_38580 [Streptomyces thermocoprophilus]